MEIFKVIETDDKFRFQFEDNEDATEFRDLLRDAGISAKMDDRDRNYWSLIVQKESIINTFFREFVLLRSPKKYVDQRSIERKAITGGIKRR